MNKVNLLKAVYFLYTQVPEAKFDMELHREGDQTLATCNTSGSMGGWLTSIIPQKHIVREENNDIDFAPTIISILNLSDDEYLFLDSQDWIHEDNSLKGCCQRILYLLTSKKPNLGIFTPHPYQQIDVLKTYNLLKNKYENNN